MGRETSGAGRENLMAAIPYGRQTISSSDVAAVEKVLRSDFLTQGPAVPAFEAAVSRHCGAKHAVAVNNATSALHLACLALDVGRGDVVWTSPVTFVASANCALYCGAEVDFVDIDPKTYNLSLEHLAEKLSRARKAGSLPKVVIPVHLAGQSCDMAAIHALARQYGFKVIEDASHAIGGRYKGEPVGNCRYSDITIFSFHPVKIITTGEGGMALTNDEHLARRLGSLRSHGLTTEAAAMHPREPGEIWNYQQIELGFNCRLTDIQAALGSSQMERLDEFVARRHVIAEHYDRTLSSLPVITPWQHPDTYSSYHLYIIRLKLADIRKTHRQIYNAMRAAGVLVNLHYIPVYRQPYYERMGFAAGYCPNAERYFADALSIPMYAGLTDEDQEAVIRALDKSLSE
jgi:UDP-4-amino-4,6-dideoxy-N-acetyl-beta-L-altrosamine transaminase